MPHPNRAVLIAILESYLDNKKKDWLKEGQTMESLPEDSMPRRKKATCDEVIKEFKQFTTMESRIKLIEDLLERQKTDETVGSELSNATYHISRYIHKPNLVLSKALHACRSYIQSTIETESVFTEAKTEIIKRIVELKATKEVTGSLSEDKTKELENLQNKLHEMQDVTYHNTYFLEEMKDKNALSKELNENTFDDFVKNVKSGERKTEIQPDEPVENIKPARKTKFHSLFSQGQTIVREDGPQPQSLPCDSAKGKEKSDIMCESSGLRKRSQKPTSPSDSTKEKDKSDIVAEPVGARTRSKTGTAIRH